MIKPLIIISIFILAFFFSAIGGYREIEILCARGSYKWKDFKRRLYKFSDQNNAGEKNKDSFHISNGFMFLFYSFVSSLVLYLALELSLLSLFINTILFWGGMMWIRNIIMHVVLPIWRKGNYQLRLFYLFPPPLGGFLDNKFGVKKNGEPAAKI